MTAAGTPSKPCCYWRYTDLSLVFLGVALCIRKGIARLPVGPLARSQRNIWCLFFVVHTRYGVIEEHARFGFGGYGVDKLWASAARMPAGPALARVSAVTRCGHNILCCSAQKPTFSAGRRNASAGTGSKKALAAKSRAWDRNGGLTGCKAERASCRHLVIPAWARRGYPI